MLMLGGFMGFGIGILLGVANSGSWQGAIWKSALAAYIAGLLMRWWGNIWSKCVRESYSEKAEQQQRTQDATAKPSV